VTLKCPECRETYFSEEVAIKLWRPASITRGDGEWLVSPHRRVPKEITDDEIRATGRLRCNECEHVFEKPLDKPMVGQLDLLA
jgi:hypothetical protein